MRKTIAIAAALVVAASLSFAGVVRTTKSEITLKKFGTFTSEQTEKLSGDKRISDIDGTFKGKGLLGGIFKAFFPTGKTSELVDLAAKTITQIDHKRKQYTITSIEKFAADRNAAMAEQRQQEQAKPAETESDIRIVKSEFKVTDASETKTINGFPCKKYLALWTVDWENVKTGDKGTDRLETALWTTPGEALASAQAEELAFGTAYLKAMGLDLPKLQSDVLGTQWISLLSGLDPAGQGVKMDANQASVAAEMAKISGYPIVIDGKYYPTPKFKAQGDEGGIQIGGALGKLGAGLLKKKADPEAEKAPSVAFYTEVKSINVTAVDAAELQVPAGYKQK